MKSRNRVLLLALILISFMTDSYAQSTIRDNLLAVDIDIISQDSIYTRPNSYLYISVLSVFNTQDTTVNFWISTGSWQRYNWVSSNDSVEIFYNGCDFCDETLIKLPPHKSLKFFACLIGNKQFIQKDFQLGFLVFNSLESLLSYGVKNHKKTYISQYWSKPKWLESQLQFGTYKIE